MAILLLVINLKLLPRYFYLTCLLPGNRDIFLVKYDSTGTLLWTSEQGTTSIDAGRGVAVSVDGFIYVVGGVSQASLNGQPTKGKTSLSSDFFDN